MVATTLPMPPVGALVAAFVAVVPVVLLAVVFDVDLAVVVVDPAVVPVAAAVVDVVPFTSPAVVVVTSPVVEVVDSTGAGDAFAAGYLKALMDGSRPDQALRFATAVAASDAATPEPGRIVPGEIALLLEKTILTDI